MRLRQRVGVDQEDVRGALRRASRDEHALHDRGRFVQHRRVRRVEPGEIGHHRLEGDERLQPPLGDLGLIGGVGGVPRRVLEHVARDDRGGVGVVVAESDHRPRDGVAVGERAQLGERFGLGGGLEIEAFSVGEPDGCRNGRLQESGGVGVADRVEHDPLGGTVGADVAGGEGRGSARHACPPVSFAYASWSRSPSTAAGSTVSLMSHPWPKGSEFTSDGSSTASSLTAETVPVSGA